MGSFDMKEKHKIVPTSQKDIVVTDKPKPQVKVCDVDLESEDQVDGKKDDNSIASADESQTQRTIKDEKSKGGDSEDGGKKWTPAVIIALLSLILSVVGIFVSLPPVQGIFEKPSEISVIHNGDSTTWDVEKQVLANNASSWYYNLYEANGSFARLKANDTSFKITNPASSPVIITSIRFVLDNFYPMTDLLAISYNGQDDGGDERAVKYDIRISSRNKESYAIRADMDSDIYYQKIDSNNMGIILMNYSFDLPGVYHGTLIATLETVGKATSEDKHSLTLVSYPFSEVTTTQRFHYSVEPNALQENVSDRDIYFSSLSEIKELIERYYPGKETIYTDFIETDFVEFFNDRMKYSIQ